MFRLINTLKLCLFATCVSVVFVPENNAHAQDSNLNLDWTNDFANSVRVEAEKTNIPGFVFVVIERGQTAKFYTYGRTERGGNKVDINTSFRLASVSKTFTAALISSENQNGSTLNWQTPIKELTPEHSFDNYDAKPILLRHVVGQSAGFMRNAYDNLIEANYSPERVLGKFHELDSLCEPGYCYTYQNALFGVINEHLLKQDTSYPELLQKRFFDPLNMKATVGKSSLEETSNWAKPHVAVRKNRWAKVKVKNTYYNFAPAAGINASAKDMSIWLRAMLLEYPDVVNAEMITEMTLPRVQTRSELRKRGWREHLRSAHYGLGWRVYDFKGVDLNYHGGWVQGYRANVSFSQELGVGFAFLMNAESNIINQVTADFWVELIEQNKSNSTEVRLTAE